MSQQSIRANPDVHWKTVNDEAVLVHFESGTYFALDAMGTYLWRQIAENETGIETAQLKAKTLEEFDCDPSQVDSDIQEFCAQLGVEDLVQTIN